MYFYSFLKTFYEDFFRKLLLWYFIVIKIWQTEKEILILAI